MQFIIFINLYIHDMEIKQILSLVAPIGLIVAGVIIKISKSKERFGIFKNFSYFFIILGTLLLVYRISKLG